MFLANPSGVSSSTGAGTTVVEPQLPRISSSRERRDPTDFDNAKKVAGAAKHELTCQQPGMYISLISVSGSQPSGARSRSMRFANCKQSRALILFGGRGVTSNAAKLPHPRCDVCR